MNNKDLFNAINDAAEEFAPEVWESTEGARPIILRAEKKPRSAKRIAVTAAACTAAAVMLGTAVTVGVNGYRQRGAVISGESDALSAANARNFAPSAEIMRIRDVGFYREDLRDEIVKELEEWYGRPMSKEEFSQLVVMDYEPPQPEVYFYNDVPLDKRMLSNEAYGWLSRYCLLSEVDRAGEVIPDEVKYLAEDGFVRFGDLGFIRGKYTDEQFENIKGYLEKPYIYQQLSSVIPPKPDVYYYNEVPYSPDRVRSNARKWLNWFCRLDEETQAALSGYVPEELMGVTEPNFGDDEEILIYKGIEFDMSIYPHDVGVFIKWYNSLSAELQAKVGYEPNEMDSDMFGEVPRAELPIDLIGADGVRLDGDWDRIFITKQETVVKDGVEGDVAVVLTDDEIEQWDNITCYGFVYLAEPGSKEFKRYNVGDEICGLKITYAYSEFSRLEDVSDPALYYTGGEVKFEGEISVDITSKKSQVTINDYYYAVTGLPTILVDGAERSNGRIIPKEETQPQDGGKVDDYTHLTGENDRIRDSGGNIVHGIKLHNISMAWHYQEQLPEYHWIEAELCYEPGHSEAMDWAAGGLTLPSDEIADEFNFIKYSLSEVTYNSEVRAVDDGEAVFADNGFSWNRGLGKMVIIKHGERLYTILGHMSADKDLCVKVGDKVKAGDVIGYAGDTGYVAPADGKGIVSYYFSSEKPDFFN